MFTSSRLVAKKPDDAFFQGMLAQLPQDRGGTCLYWDDHPANVEAGARHGLDARLFTSAEQFLRETGEELGIEL